MLLATVLMCDSKTDYFFDDWGTVVVEEVEMSENVKFKILQSFASTAYRLARLQGSLHSAR